MLGGRESSTGLLGGNWTFGAFAIEGFFSFSEDVASGSLGF